jgi:hypothetical protein
VVAVDAGHVFRTRPTGFHLRMIAPHAVTHDPTRHWIEARINDASQVAAVLDTK